MKCWLPVLIVLLAVATGSSSAKSQPHFKVEVDTSAAEAILNAATSDAAHASAAADAAAGLPAVAALIAKEHKYNSKASRETFKADVLAVVAGRPTLVFPLKALRDDPGPSREFLRSIKTSEAEIERRLGEGLEAFAPDDTNIDAKLVLILGSNQNGWVPEQKSTTFYADAGRHIGDIDGLLALVAHELFHVVQGAWQPDWNPVFAETSQADAPEARIRHNLHAAFVNLVVEGMATYVGDPARWSSGPHTPGHDEREYAREVARSAETFALFDTVIYRFSHDETAPLNTLLDIDFGGAWDQTGYYVGYQMAKAIDKYAGRARLRSLVGLSAEEFVRAYVTVAKAHPEDADIVQLSPATIAALSKVPQE